MEEKTLNPGKAFYLKAILFSNGISMRQFALSMGISPSYLCKILKGKRAYTEEINKKIINALNNLEKGEK